jgi:hypothetical protein
MTLPNQSPLPISQTLFPHQIPPEGDWQTWWMLGGRGAGKTAAALAWSISQAIQGRVVAFRPAGAGRERQSFDHLCRLLEREGLTHKPRWSQRRVEITTPTTIGEVRFGPEMRGMHYDDLVVDGFHEFDNTVEITELVDPQSTAEKPRVRKRRVSPLELSVDGREVNGPRDELLINWVSGLRSVRPRMVFTAAHEPAPDVRRTMLRLQPAQVTVAWANSPLSRDTVRQRLEDWDFGPETAE